jgi:hypothetical protein
MKRLILALLLLCLGTAATAQSFPKPVDVPDYVPVTPVYTTNGTANVERDVNVTPPPVYSYELTNIPIPSTTGRLYIGNTGQSDFCPISATCPQAKFRTYADFSHMLPDDPIRNFGQPGASHLHCFFGAGSTNAYSTYKLLRKKAIDSTAVGTDANGTGYWYPCPVKINPFADGKNYAIKADFVVIYYVSDTPAEMFRAAHLPAGLRYVLGYEMDDDWAWLQTILDGYNATIGHARYSVRGTSNSAPYVGLFNGEPYYVCAGATATTPYGPAGSATATRLLKNADGSDPFNGTCNSGADFYIVISGPDCYDGVNLWSPGGYKHVIPRAWDSDKRQWVCPTNYYKIPSLQLQIHITQNGWADRQSWVLSSDLSKRAATGQDETVWPAGKTFHTDWMNGWDQDILLTWNHGCLGTDNSTPHQCNTSAISGTQRLVGAFIDGDNGMIRHPQITTTSNAHINATDPGFMLIPPAWNGSLTGMHMHH